MYHFGKNYSTTQKHRSAGVFSIGALEEVSQQMAALAQQVAALKAHAAQTAAEARKASSAGSLHPPMAVPVSPRVSEPGSPRIASVGRTGDPRAYQLPSPRSASGAAASGPLASHPSAHMPLAGHPAGSIPPAPVGYARSSSAAGQTPGAAGAPAAALSREAKSARLSDSGDRQGGLGSGHVPVSIYRNSSFSERPLKAGSQDDAAKASDTAAAPVSFSISTASPSDCLTVACQCQTTRL